MNPARIWRYPFDADEEGPEDAADAGVSLDASGEVPEFESGTEL